MEEQEVGKVESKEDLSLPYNKNINLKKNKDFIPSIVQFYQLLELQLFGVPSFSALLNSSSIQTFSTFLINSMFIHYS